MRINAIIALCLIILLSNCSHRGTQIVDFNYSPKCEKTVKTWGDVVECLIRKKTSE